MNIVLGKCFHTSKEVCKVKPLICVDFEQALQEACDLGGKVTKGGGREREGAATVPVTGDMVRVSVSQSLLTRGWLSSKL